MEVIGFDSDKRLHTTSGFTQAGVYSRRQFGADIQVCSPQELLCNPRLREAANTLCASKILRFLASLSVEIGVTHFEYLEKKFRSHG